MRKHKFRSAAATLLSLVLLFWTFSDSLPRACALDTDPETGAFLISSLADLREFARACTVNTWSQGKLIRLTRDLDLTGRSFLPVPTFSGEFSGEGFTISGLNLSATGSNMGVFRYVQEGAIIRSLNVTGAVRPGGDAEQVGGIVGINAGSVLDCSFTGSVIGRHNVGGIVGENMETGEVSGCTMNGAVQGRRRTGGIVGHNRGLLLKCWNESAVNTSAPGESVQVSEAFFDTGGIAGTSTGVLQSCTNVGPVGVPHTGYNTGGIVGRQSGYLAAAENRGTVRGRKDVGGIAGQAEPDITLLADPTVLSELRSQLNTLNELIDNALTGNEANRSGLARQFQQLQRNTNTARDLSQRLVDQSSRSRETTVTNIRSMASSVAGALDRITLSLTTFSGASTLAATAEEQLDASIGALEDTRILEAETIDALRAGTEELRNATAELSGTISTLQTGMEELENAVLVQDNAAQKEALWKLSDAVGAVAEAETQRRNALESMGSSLNRGFPLNTNDVQAALGRVNASLRDQVSALRTIGDSIAELARRSSIDWDQLEQGLRGLRQPVNALLSAVKKISGAASDLASALRNLEDPSGQLLQPMAQMAGAADTLSGIGTELESGCTDLYRAVSDLQETGPVSVTVTSNTEELRSTGNSLYSALGTLTNTADALTVAVNRMENSVSANLQGISQQLNAVSEAMVRTLENINNGSVGADTIVTDVSDHDVSGTRLGKITESVNIGALEADRNAGGIAGMIGIEYEIDPEDDVTGPQTFGSTLETRAVVQACRNQGAVTTRKDYVGGIVGRMNLGTLAACENYGTVKSTAGGYAGGLAGRSGGIVRESWSRCTVSGERFVGGIAGEADVLRNCRAIPTFATVADGMQSIGSIAGSADTADGRIQGNLFLDTGVGGIDGISYIGIAEPASWETLLVEGDPPEAFTECAVVFVIDGVEVERIPFQYEDDLSGITLPDIPEKGGLHGYWPSFDTTGLHPDITLEPVYEPWITMLSSEEKAGQQPLVLAEGNFTRESVLSVTESDVGAPVGSDAMVMDIRLEGAGLTENDLVPIRLLNRTGTQATVWRFHDSRWRTVGAETSGHYLLVTMEGDSGTYCVIPGGAGQTAMIRHLIPIAAAVLLVLILAAVIRGNHYKGKHEQKAEKT
ncbi:MAG: hypothetical protein IJR54_00685 [Oscillibacter sp.]|nr:hypothetical protein [Oscillibacter sp.]